VMISIRPTNTRAIRAGVGCIFNGRMESTTARGTLLHNSGILCGSYLIE
jgi:hypothetical protein